MLDKIKTAGIDLSYLGEDLLVPFQARQLANPKVIWINRRWFASKLEVILTDELMQKVSAWLISEFGFVVPRPEDPSNAFTSKESTFYADRYGDDARAPHGGSGRVGIRHRFQVKGIGVTPLVGRYAGLLHQSGCVWLEEALREAMLGELVSHEFPHGAVPVVAILDTGLDANFTRDSPDRRRVLLIRPSFARPAHMQRAPLFKPLLGDERKAQLADGRRSKQATIILAANEKLLRKTFLCAARQLAYAYIHRICLGGMLASNWTMHGALVDFGGVSGVPDWADRSVSSSLPAFGKEHLAVETAIEYILHRARRFVPSWRGISTASVVSEFRMHLNDAIKLELRRLSSTHENKPLDLMSLVSMIELKRDGITQEGIPSPLTDRSLLERHALQAWIRDLCPSDNDGEARPGWAYALIATGLMLLRRDWPLMPSGARALAQYLSEDSAAVICEWKGKFWIYLECEGAGECIGLFGRKMAGQSFHRTVKHDRTICWKIVSYNEAIISDLNLPPFEKWFIFDHETIMKEVN